MKKALSSLMQEVHHCEEMLLHRLEHGHLAPRDLEEMLQTIEWLEEMKGFIKNQTAPTPSPRRRMALSLASFGRSY